MIETALVSLMCQAGISHARAVSLERWLDDSRPAGMSGDMLAGLIGKIVRDELRSQSSELDSCRVALALYSRNDSAVNSGFVPGI